MGINQSTIILSIFVFLSASITIWANYRQAKGLILVFKPLTMLLILIIAFRSTDPVSTFYKIAIIAGLLFSLAGDVLIIPPFDSIFAAFISFSLAHIVYIFAFASTGGFYFGIFGLLLILAPALILLAVLWPNLGRMRIPGIIYLTLIVLMVWQAFGQWQRFEDMRTLFALGGAVLFLISDMALTLNRFSHPFKCVHLVVLGTYFPAQLLIALSI